jgi:hypothetical protein
MKTSIAIGVMALVAILGPARESSAQSVDPFTTSQASGNAGAPWVSIPNSLFAERQLQRFNNATASLGSGAWTMGANQSSTPTSNGSSYLNYRQDSVGSTIDLSGIASMSFDITVTGTVSLNWYLEDANGNNLIQSGALVAVSGTGTQTLDFSTATMDPGFDLSAVTGMSVRFTGISAGESATVTNLTSTPLTCAFPMDSLTLAQNSSGNGFGAAWASPPGSLFNQRQVARFNSAGTGTASVTGGAWTAFLPQFNPTGSSSASVLTYRQDSSFSTIDLSGIESMSFNINVIAGSVSGSFYVMDENGFTAEVPDGFVRSVGTSSVTLDLSTAAIDTGIDLSKVVQMQVWISATSVNSQFSVTNFTYTLPCTFPMDSLTLAQNSSGNGFGAAWASPPDSLFTVRQVARFNSAGTGTASIAGGAWTAFLPRATSGRASSSVLTYRQDRYMSSTIDLSGIDSMSFDINVIAGSVSGYFHLMDENGFIAEVPDGFVRSVGTSSVTLDLSTAAIDTGFDLSKVVQMQVWISATSVNSRFSVTNLTYR